MWFFLHVRKKIRVRFEAHRPSPSRSLRRLRLWGLGHRIWHFRKYSGWLGRASDGGGGASVAGAGNASTGGSSGDPETCSSNTDCQILPQSCCDCGSADIAAYKAVNSRGADAGAAVCEGVRCSCPLQVPGPDFPALYFVPTCRAGRCELVDLRSTELAACTTAADCGLRSGTACCQGCGDNAVAINRGAESGLEQLVCGAEPMACGRCAPIYTDLGVDCVATDPASSSLASHCVVVSTLCTRCMR